MVIGAQVVEVPGSDLFSAAEPIEIEPCFSLEVLNSLCLSLYIYIIFPALPFCFFVISRLPLPLFFFSSPFLFLFFLP